ncbi:MAG TPA: DnaJ domain-containing protein [Hyphomicrobiaceae bacterium]|nr:DnaJ domain-containing protein [Hyphomicrobiaceae bacterium]
MKLDSKYFDQIRVTRTQAGKPKAETTPVCAWKGCTGKGLHKAPRGRGQEGKYYLFCPDHIKEYNANYNYFQGMSDAEVASFQKDAITGHRPTWKTGATTGSPGTSAGKKFSEAGTFEGRKVNDPHGFFAWRAKRQASADEAPRRYVKPIERKSLETLHLGENATSDEIKAKFKALVKLHHPDANGGDKRSEDTLREIIQAYNYLKQAGLV